MRTFNFIKLKEHKMTRPDMKTRSNNNPGSKLDIKCHYNDCLCDETGATFSLKYMANAGPAHYFHSLS